MRIELLAKTSDNRFNLFNVIDGVFGLFDGGYDVILGKLRKPVMAVGEPLVKLGTLLSDKAGQAFHFIRPGVVKVCDPIWKMTFGILDGETRLFGPKTFRINPPSSKL